MEEFLIALISGGIGSAIAAYVSIRMLRPRIEQVEAERDRVLAEAAKIRAEGEDIEACASEKIVGATIALMEPLSRQLKEQHVMIETLQKRISVLESERGTLIKKHRALEVRLSSVEAENKHLWRGIRTLSRQVQDLGEEPAWRPAKEGS